MVTIPVVKEEKMLNRSTNDKRKRGRPRKVRNLDDTQQNDSSRGNYDYSTIDYDSNPNYRSNVEPVKRKRGRPRKIQNPNELMVPQTKKKRGRPRKVRDLDGTLPNISSQETDIDFDDNDDTDFQGSGPSQNGKSPMVFHFIYI